MIRRGLTSYAFEVDTAISPVHQGDHLHFKGHISDRYGRPYSMGGGVASWDMFS